MNKDFWEKVNRLKELAGKATKGEWVIDKDANYIRVDPQRLWVFWIGRSSNSDENASYVIAANPTIILEIITELQNLEKEFGWLVDYLCGIACSRDIKPCEENKTCRECWIQTAKEFAEKEKLCPNIDNCIRTHFSADECNSQTG